MITDEHLRETPRNIDEASVSDGAAQTENGKARRFVFWLQGIAFLLGVALLVYVINRVGLQPIFDALGRIGFGFFILLAINGSRHVLRTLAMRTAVPPEHRQVNIFQAFAARLGGEAVSFLTFTGPVLGEATKVALLKKRVPLVSGVSALVIDNILYYLSVVFFILGGALVMLASYSLPRVVDYTLLAIAAFALLGIVAAALAHRRRVMLLTWLIDRLARSGIHPRALTSRREHIYQLESNVYDFYDHHPGSFFAILGYNILSHASSVVEVYVTLRMLGFSPQVQAAYVIESLTKVINFVFGFVPATIGVYEGGTEVILRTLGFAAATGVTLALVRKAGTVFWTAIGLVILLWRAMPSAASRLMERSPRFRKLMDSLVLSNIAHRPARTIVSVLGIGIGVLLIVFTTGLAHGVLRERGRREANLNAEIRVSAAGTMGLTGSQPFALPTERAREIARIPGVRAALPIGQKLLPTESGFGNRLVDGINFEEYAAITGLTVKEGRKLESGYEAIVDSVWQQERRTNVVGTTIRLFERDYKIVGVYDPPGGGRVKIPLKTMQEEVGALPEDGQGEERCTAILVSCNNPAEQEEVAARIRQQFPEDQIIFTRDLPELYASGLPALNVFINVVVAIAAAISMLVILLAMYTTVTERTRQIGVLKSLGMSKASIAWVIEQEAILVSVLGVLTGIGLTLLIRFAVMRSTSLIIDIETRWLLVALAVGLVGGTIGALYPALRAARQDAVEALGYE
ncbi:MAG TPA: ABC transporter permease [Pyrinomonadaceae bacterium]|jgi:putative ABC transport system permease protein